MHKLKAIGAFLLFVGSFIVISLTAGFFVVSLMALQMGHELTWWKENGVPVVSVIISMTIGAGMAAYITGRAFTTVNTRSVAWAFVALLALVWAINIVWFMLGHPIARSDISGLAGAIAAAITVISQTARYRRQGSGLQNR